MSAVALPKIDGDRCVHGLCATATCTACVSACPRQAFLMTDDALTFDASQCDGCGLCRPACPEAAIGFEGVSFSAYLDQDNASALFACERAGAGAGSGIVPCLHAIGERDLDEAAASGIKEIVSARGACSSCSRSTSKTLELALARVNLRRLSRRQPPLGARDVEPAAWSRLRRQASERGNDIDQSRRGLLGIKLKAKSVLGLAVADENAAVGSAALFYVVPTIDLSRCNGCDACTRICPHGAVQLQTDAAGPFYRIAPQHCTGCHLCVDVCEVDAVTLQAMAPANATRVTLKSATCSKCGAPFHQPSIGAAEPVVSQGRRGNTQVCRICQKKNHAATLFQVRE